MSDLRPGRSTFRRARRREAYRRLADVVRRRGEREQLLSLDEVQRRLRVFEQSYVGIRAIPVSKIVGTVSRTGDFDRDFLPRRSEIGERWKRVEETFAEGDFPPITVYELDGSYFVVDGHHRVAVARQWGVETIDAEITRLRGRWRLPEGADIGRIIMAEQQQLFLEESGLARARPEARIEFSRPPGYIELLENIKIHGYNLIVERGEILSKEEIAADWYDRVYLPTVGAIKREGLWDLWPHATKADLFLWVSQRRRELFPDLGGMDIDEAVRAARETSRKS
ncbi:MAG TPA: ParB N-terminal domain-containing protein [Actinomycetota bacterium]|nr:ParB N-terminal domain-containing protein [Actinomycetota bacterium]